MDRVFIDMSDEMKGDVLERACKRKKSTISLRRIKNILNRLRFIGVPISQLNQFIQIHFRTNKGM